MVTGTPSLCILLTEEQDTPKPDEDFVPSDDEMKGTAAKADDDYEGLGERDEDYEERPKRKKKKKHVSVPAKAKKTESSEITPEQRSAVHLQSQRSRSNLPSADSKDDGPISDINGDPTVTEAENSHEKANLG
jgi:hypothetical protein